MPRVPTLDNENQSLGPTFVDAKKQFLPSIGQAGSTQCLKESLARWLWSRCERSPETTERITILLDSAPLRDKTISQFCEEVAKCSLEKLAEVCGWLSDSQGVCEILNISAFDQLSPGQSHRYLAYLAREGIINEVITTNWDTCIENALMNSYGSRAKARRERDNEIVVDPMRVEAIGRVVRVRPEYIEANAVGQGGKPPSGNPNGCRQGGVRLAGPNANAPNSHGKGIE